VGREEWSSELCEKGRFWARAGIERWNGSEIDEKVFRLATRERNIKFRNSNYLKKGHISRESSGRWE